MHSLQTRVVVRPVAASDARANRREYILLILYFSAVVLISDLLNVRLGVELLTLVVVVAALVISHAGTAFFRDWWFFLAGLVLWNLSGPIAAASPFSPHLDFMLTLDRVIGGGRVPAVVLQQAWFSPSHIGALDWIAAISYNMHLSEPYIVGFLLWRTNRLVYLQFASAALLLLVAGFVAFILFPAVPPWMASTKMHRIPDVINAWGPIWHTHPFPFHGTPIFYVFHLRGDAVAAFPSEHAAFPLLEFLACFSAARRWSPLLLLWVFWVLVVIVFLGEHWVTDALGGWAFSLGCWLLVRHLTRAVRGAPDEYALRA